MRRQLRIAAFGLAMLCGVAGAPFAPAARAFGGGGGFGGQYNGRQGRGAQTNLRQSILGRMQQTAGFTDDEWTVVEPKMWNVVTLQMLLGEGPLATYTQRFAGRGGAGQADPLAQLESQEDPAIAQLSKNLDQARQALQTAATDPTTNAASMETVMIEYRGALKKVQDALAAAQKDLQSVLTLHEEAILLMSGYLS